MKNKKTHNLLWKSSGVGFRYIIQYINPDSLGLQAGLEICMMELLKWKFRRTAGYRSVNCFSSKSEIYNDRRYGH